jgi:acetyl esterase/lipase
MKLVLKTGYSVVLPNYRLTPRETTKDDYLRHPTHAEDLLIFLDFVIDWDGPEELPAKPYNPQRIYLIGHSCGAHMLTSIVLDSSFTTPSLAPSPSILRAIQGIVMSEGIYDLELLLESFPRYRDWFIRDAFGEDKPLSNYATTTYPLRDSSTHIQWLIIHSTGDHLIDFLQSEVIFNHLSLSYGSLADRFVFKNFDKLTGGHDDILTKDKDVETYTQIVRDFILAT